MSEPDYPSRHEPDAPVSAAPQPQAPPSADLAAVCRQTLEDYLACRKLVQSELKVQLPNLQPGRITFRRETVTGWQTLLAQVEKFAPQSGWIAWQCSAADEAPLVMFDTWDARLLQRLSHNNALLEAEFGRGDAGLHLRLLGEDCWYWTEAGETAGATGFAVAGDPASLPAIVESVSHIGKKGAACLNYRVGWLVNMDGTGFHPRISYLCRLQTGDQA